VLRLETALRKGLIGDVLEIHTVGKMGSRAGGQDMMVLGLHVFDLARLFAGEVQWCQSRIRHQGRLPAISAAKESPSDKVGPVVGDDIFAHFAMDSGVNLTFRSRAGLEKAAGPFGLEIIGSRGIVRLISGAVPTLSILSDGLVKSRHKAAPTAFGKRPEQAPGPLLKLRRAAQTFGSSKPLRCTRPINALAAASSKVSVAALKRSFLPVRQAMLPAWHITVLMWPE
jgi:hypothetical protein